MQQNPFRKKKLTRLAVVCLGTSALTLPAYAANFSVGSGTINTTQADASSDSTGTGGPFALQANTVTSGDVITVTGISITNSSHTPSGRALDLGGLLASSGSYSVTMHGSTLAGDTGFATGGAGAWFQSVGGLVSFDSTGGAANTISGKQGLAVINNTSNGGVSIKTGADSITSSSGEALYGVAQGSGTISIDIAGATLNSSSLYGIAAVGGNGFITIGGLNGGLSGTINAASGSGIFTTSTGNQSITLASTGVINALNGMTLGGAMSITVDSFGTINASNNAISGASLVTLKSSSVTTGKILGGNFTETFNIVAGANVSGATFDGSGGTDALNLTGSGNGSFAVTSTSNIEIFEKTGTGIWTLTGTTTNLTPWTITTGAIAISNDAALGADGLTLQGGTLQTTSTTSGTRSIVLNAGGGAFDVAAATTLTEQGVISGAGGLTKVGSGTLVLTATETYAGGTTIGAGTLQIGNGGTTGSMVSDVIDNGALVFNRSNTLIYAGIISGGGSVTQAGTGKTILTGSISYNGATISTTTISAGMLQIGDGGTTGAINGNIVNNGVLVINRSDSYLLNNQMSGSGTVEFTGTGTLVVPSLPAPTIMRSGTLQVNNLLGLPSLTMLDGTTLVSPQHNIEGTAISLQGNVTFRNVGEVLTAPITDGSGPGHLIVANGSILSLLGANTYSGGTTIQPGSTLNLGAAHFTAAGSVQGAIVNNGLLQVITEVNTTFNNAVSGTGQFQKTGAGILTITSAMTYTGGTVMDSGLTFPGTIRLGAGGGLPTGGAVSFLTTRDAVLDLNGHNQTIGALTYVPPDNQTAPLVSILTGSGTLTVGDSSSTIFAGAISGTGTLIKAGSGKLTLAGTSLFNGNMLISAGTLSVTSYQPVNASPTTASLAASAITVQSGGTLAGTGTVGTTTVQNGGTLAPGNSVGTLTVNGNLTLASGANYGVEVSPTAADRTVVSGVANLNGTVIASVAPGSYAFGQRYTLLTATNGVSGTFAFLTGVPITLKGQLSYDAGNAYLTLSPSTLAPVLGNATGNQQKLVSAIDATVTAGAVPGGGFVTLYGLSGTALNSALDQISGQVGPNTINAVGQASLSFLNMTAQGGSGGDNFAPGSAYNGSDAPHRAQLGAGQTRVWASAYGGHVGLSADAASGAASLSASNVGLIGGADMAWEDGLLAGVTLGLGQQHFSSGSGTGSSDDIMIGVYARKDAGPLYVTAAFGYGAHHIESLRAVTISGTDVLQGKQNADDFGGRVEAGWRTALDDQFTLSPYFAVAAESFESPAYTETALSGASTFALSLASRSSTLGRTELGSGLSRDYETENGVMTADLRAAWAHQLDDVPLTQASFQSLPGASFLVAGVRPASDTALLGAHVQVQNRSGLFFGLKAETQLGVGTTILEGMGNLGWRW